MGVDYNSIVCVGSTSEDDFEKLPKEALRRESKIFN